MSLRLRIEHGQDAGKTFRLPGPGVYTIGRKTAVSMRVLDMKVSADHCEIRMGPDGAVFHDAGSTHGSLLNGQPVRPDKDKVLNPGDELRLGMTIIRVLSDGDADVDLQPAAGREVGESSVDTSGQSGKTKTTLPPDELVGKDLGGYQIDRKIGAGGMGGVYLAEQISLKRKVALKVLNEQFASDSAFVDQFVNEARAAGALNHPNVVQVYDVGNAEGHYFFSMEVMPGGSIEDKIKEGPVEWETGLNWFIDAANALIFAKRREILHRDVKPDNLMIGEDESAKLCDLGLAKKSEVSDLMDQGIIGTPHFISPEAIRRKGDINHRTDLYSLGCTFYRVFSGRNPYPGTTVKEILLGHLNKPVPHINEVNRDVPKEIDEVVAQLMAKDPDERIQTPEELLRVLDKIRTTYNLAAHGIKPGSKKPLIIVAAIAVLAIGGLATWIATREEKTEVIQLSEAEQAQLDAATRLKIQNEVDTSVLRNDLVKLQLELSKADLSDGDNWQKKIFPNLVTRFRDLATTWNEKAGSWRADKAEVTDEITLGYYDEAIANVEELSSKAREEADGIEKFIQTAEASQAERASKRAQALAAIETAIKQYVEKIKKLQQEGDWVALETSLKKNEIDEILEPLVAESFAGRPLVKYDTDVKPLLDKQLPADKEGARGTQAIAMAAQMIEKAASARLGEAQALLANDPGHKEYLEALQLLRSYEEGLPDVSDAMEAAPLAAAAYTRVRKSVTDRISEIDEAQKKQTDAQLRHDKQLYFDLLKTLWAPREAGGLLQRFEFVGAKAAAERAEKEAQDPRYQRLVRSWLPAIQALRGTFDRVIEGYPDAWTEDEFYEVDEKGRKKRKKIKAIDKRTLTFDKDPVSFAELGPAWLLENLFFLDGKPRLKTMTAEDHYGLAVLAELAVDYELAKKEYMTAVSGYDADPAATTIRERLGTLDLDRQAGELWKSVRDWLVEQEQMARTFQAMVDAQASDPDAFTKEERDQVLNWHAEYGGKIGFITANREKLARDPVLAGSNWGSALRDAPHPDVAYAGEKLPAPEKGAPKKPDPKKDGG